MPALTRPNPVLLESGTFYVAEAPSGQLAGCGGWTFECPGSGEAVPRLAHIRHFATHPEWLRKGIGRMIYARCESAASSAGACEFQCFAGLNAVAFYEALGFKSISRMDLSLGPDVTFPVALMKRPL